MSAKSRMCGEGDETVSHIVSECRKLAQKQFISILEARQDKVGLMIHSFGTYVESWVMAGMKEA